MCYKIYDQIFHLAKANLTQIYDQKHYQILKCANKYMIKYFTWRTPSLAQMRDKIQYQILKCTTNTNTNI